MPEPHLPLSEIKVLDLTQARAGPTCVRHLADWGADVIRIEAPPTADERNEVVGRREGFDHQNLNRNKRGMTLNLKDPRGLEIFMRMAKDADVIVENQRPRVKHRLGIDYATIREINPGIVFGSLSGFGQEGPYVDRAGLDQVAQGMSGLMSVTGNPGQGPMRAGVAITDLTSGTFLALGIMMALFGRYRTGEGRWVTTSLLESMIAMLDFQAARWLMKREVPLQEGNFHPTGTPTGAYPTADGHINISAPGSKLWERLCKAFGVPELASDPRYATLEGRAKNRNEVNELVAEYTRGKTTAEWVVIFDEIGVPAGPIYSIQEVFADPQVMSLGMSKNQSSPARRAGDGGAGIHNISGFSKDIRRPTPGVGEHTDEVLSELGLDRAEIRNMRNAGII